MRVTKIGIGVILLGTIHSVSAFAATAEHATATGPLKNHDDAVINAFEVMCTLEPENFEHISARAQAMVMRKSVDKTEKQSPDITRHLEVFEGNLTTGPFSLLLEKISGPTINATNCGVASNTPNKRAYFDDIVRTLHLSQNTSKRTSSNGNTVTTWDNVYGPHTFLDLTDLRGSDGVLIQLLDAPAKSEKP
ncbi:hypothetical protein ATY75_19210 [Rhizobium sp. N122]|uniref:hypothetical protein n=1 Tax=Rhizobium sp. N122 TaxID=1764272 RepID=UPI000B5A4F3B|nr:hypothetical protein [Rhizobium sp. N122]OWV88753.1 hypothetical protein ATY75_19210 [Rhizobium sp. N122]